MVAELKEWFEGLARVHISRYLRRDDHEKALEEAIEKLKSEHGSKASTAEEMLEELLKGKPIESKDAVGMNKAISKLEEAFFLAVETGWGFQQEIIVPIDFVGIVSSVKNKVGQRSGESINEGENNK